MEKRRLRKISQEPIVFQFFDVVTGRKENGLTFKKVICKFCQWRSVINTTRMVSHIRQNCPKCPSETKNVLVQYYGNGISKLRTNLKSRKRIPDITAAVNTAKPKKFDSFPEQFSNLQKTIVQNYDLDTKSTVPFEDWKSTAELFRRIGQISALSNIDISRNDEKSHTDSICKYELNISDSVDSSSETEQQNGNNFTSNIENSIIPNSLLKQENEYQADIKAFSEFVYYELEAIKDLEIVNEIKHNVCNLLYAAKKQYLQNKKT